MLISTGRRWRGPDQVAGETDFERTRVALAVDDRECWDREILDRGDQRGNRRLELGGPGLIKPDEDRDVRARGEIIALGSQQQGPNVTVGRLVDGDIQVGEQISAEEVLRRVVITISPSRSF